MGIAVCRHQHTRSESSMANRTFAGAQPEATTVVGCQHHWLGQLCRGWQTTIKRGTEYKYNYNKLRGHQCESRKHYQEQRIMLATFDSTSRAYVWTDSCHNAMLDGLV
mmetsp:Transcript_18794/g.34670  ORF Transcript_18794/g.34670 Transcript_18794/m.34670 type:complete len:108 (-) Transcript_18794:206-529(-)